MSNIDPISDLLTRIRNAHLAKHDRLDVPTSKLKVEICRISEGRGLHPELPARRRRARGLSPAHLPALRRRAARRRSRHLQRVSKPGRRVYRGADEIRPVLNGLRPRRRLDLRRGCSPTRRRASGASAASSSARSGEEAVAMSRVGRKPIEIPKGVKVAGRDGDVHRRGPEGPRRAEAGSGLPGRGRGRRQSQVGARGESGPERAKHGLLRALLANAVTGRDRADSRKRARDRRRRLQGRDQGRARSTSRSATRTRWSTRSRRRYQDRARRQGEPADGLGRRPAACSDRSRRDPPPAPPDPYKGKGIKYADEVIRRKVGKAGAK